MLVTDIVCVALLDGDGVDVTLGVREEDAVTELVELCVRVPVSVHDAEGVSELDVVAVALGELVSDWVLLAV